MKKNTGALTKKEEDAIAKGIDEGFEEAKKEKKEKKLKTDNKYLKDMKQLVGKMDSILGELGKVTSKMGDLESNANTTETNPKDLLRFLETYEVLQSVRSSLYWVTYRMARKYGPKKIADSLGTES